MCAAESSPWRTTDYMARCGELYITNEHSVYLHCTLCDEREQVYDKFLAHIFANHYADETVAKVTTEGELEKADELLNEESSNEAVRPEDFVEDTDEEEADQNTKAQSENEADQNNDAVELLSHRIDPRLKQPTKVGQRYKCDFCDMTIGQIFNWRAHMRRHLQPKRFACSVCKKEFHTRSELKIHERRHRGECPFMCTYCGQKFVTRGATTMHERKHLNYRPHKCDICGRGFFDSVQLRNHRVRHTGERNFTCEVCENKFMHKQALREHMKLHVNAREHVCGLCGKAFNQRPALLMHRRSTHKLISTATKQISLAESIT